MKVNVRVPVFNHAGGPAVSKQSAYHRLRRTVMACMLFEDNFYESGVKAVDRIVELCKECTIDQILSLAITASNDYHLRHIPLKMIVEALKKKSDQEIKTCAIICEIIKRPDMMTDLLALYWADGKKPLANQLKKGLAMAFCKFDEYQLSKYNRDNPVKLRDVLFLCHAKPKDETQAALWKRLVNKELKTADTWETRLSAGEDKKESFQELLESHRMGKLAILRNMRNMHEAGISKQLVADELMRNMKEMLPFQYLAAARECPTWEDIIDPAMILACEHKPKIQGRTLLLVDVSGSMDQPISSKSKMNRLDAACGMAILLRECVPQVGIYSFSEQLRPIPPRHGMSLRDAIVTSQPHSSTMLGAALNYIFSTRVEFERIIVITDEQCQDTIPRMPGKLNYILNIGGYENEVGEVNQWVTITGFSEASIDFIRELEQVDND